MTSIRRTWITSTLAIVFCLSVSGCGGYSNGSGLTGIDVAPISAMVQLPCTVQYSATAHFSNAPDADVTNNANWSSSVTSVATILNLGAPVGLATCVAAGKTMITASFVQGSSSVSASTDLNVTSGASSASVDEGVAMVRFTSGPELGNTRLHMDGREVATVSHGSAVSLEVLSGTHRFVSADGRHIFSLMVRAHRNYAFSVTEGGRLTLTGTD
jgi:hypothetical protein